MAKYPWKKSIEERVELFKQFYERKNERPLLGFFYGSEFPVHRYNAAKTIPQGRPLTPDDFPADPYLDDFDRLFDIHEECGGDFIYSASIYWGIPWIEASLGCPVILKDYTSGSIYAEKLTFLKSPDDIPDFSFNNQWVRKGIEFLEKAVKRSNGRWPLATTRMRGIADLLSLLYGDANFIFALIEKPDEVMAISEKLTRFWISFGKMQLERIPLYHGGVGSFYYNAWAPAGTIWHQEDAAALLSPELYEHYIKPWDVEIVNSFDNCIMHQHSNGYFPYNHYLEMNFTALELHIDQGGPSAENLFKVHTEIMSVKPLIIWGNIPASDLDWIFSKLPEKGLAVITTVNSPDEAKEIWERYLI